MKLKKCVVLLIVCLFIVGLAHGAEITVRWTFATNNIDGTPLTDLAGAKVYWGGASSNYTMIVDVPGGVPGGPGSKAVPVPDPTVTSASTNYLVAVDRYGATVTGPAPTVSNPTRYLNGVAYNTAGLESDFCNEVARAVTVTNGYFWGPGAGAATNWLPAWPTVYISRAGYPGVVYVRTGVRWRGGQWAHTAIRKVHLSKPDRLRNFQ